MSGFLLTRLFGAQAYEAKRFGDKAAAVRDLQIQQSMLGRWFFMFIMMFATVGPALIYLVGGHEAIAGRLTVGTIVAFVFYLGRLYGPASALVNVHVDVMSAVALFRRIFDYLDLPTEIADPASPVRLASSARRSALRRRVDGLQAGHADRRRTSVRGEARPDGRARRPERRGQDDDDVSRVPALRPVARARSRSTASICASWRSSDLSRWVANVTQETTLFNATVEENLRYGKPDATREEIERACRVAQIHDVIAGLPQGYDTVVGERGYKLSGGEKQRAGARARRAARSAPAHSRRGDVVARLAVRGADPEGARAAARRPHEPRHRAPAQHDPARGSDPRPRQGPHRRARHARRAAGEGRPLRQALRRAVPPRVRDHSGYPCPSRRLIPTVTVTRKSPRTSS